MLKRIVSVGLFMALFTLVATAQNTFPSSGNVGIGTMAPSSTLQVSGSVSTSGGDFQFDDAGTLDSTAVRLFSAGGALWLQSGYGGATYFRNKTAGTNMTILDNGNVGIGTTSPADILHALSPSYSSEADTTSGTTNAALALEATETSRTIGNGPALEFINPANSDGSNDWSQSRIMGTVSSNGGDGAIGGALWFQTRNPYDATGFPWTTNMVMLNGGNVGIGTTSPGAPLEVHGNVKVSGSGANLTFPDSTVQSTAWTGTLTGGDYAESVDVTGDRSEYEPGDVLVVDPNHPGHFLRATQRYSLAVTGVYSTKPGVLGRRQKIDKALTTTEVPMAMVGIVPTKVSTENGPIEPGDVLVTSSTLGYAMKGTDRGLLAGAVIGKALEPLNSGTGVIEVVISLQ